MTTPQLMSAPARRVGGKWLCGDCGSPCTAGALFRDDPVCDAVECTKCGRADVVDHVEATEEKAA